MNDNGPFKSNEIKNRFDGFVHKSCHLIPPTLMFQWLNGFACFSLQLFSLAYFSFFAVYGSRCWQRGAVPQKRQIGPSMMFSVVEF